MKQTHNVNTTNETHLSSWRITRYDIMTVCLSLNLLNGAERENFKAKHFL